MTETKKLLIAFTIVYPARAAEVYDAVSHHIGASILEPGCVHFGMMETTNPLIFIFAEEWKDNAAFLAHRQTDHFRNYYENIIKKYTTHVTYELR